MSYLLDSTLIIDCSMGDREGVALLRRLFEATSELFTCEVVTCETLSGGTPEGRESVRAALDALEYVAVDLEAARWAADRRAERPAGTSRRHLGDALIAGLAWRLGATVVTRNARDFEAYGVAVLGYGADET
ncbi:MAG: PIN domain-containing protein [Chloroflexi bacterium]|nr:PIN domain-containing protein [Chloroflexota bacterium]